VMYLESVRDGFLSGTKSGGPHSGQDSPNTCEGGISLFPCIDSVSSFPWARHGCFASPVSETMTIFVKF
jgi:hypothetical protein